jgi:hypothetical protein
MFLSLNYRKKGSENFLKYKEATMMLAILCFSFIVVSVVAGAAKLEIWKSSMHVTNVQWLEDSAKFSLISRWGITR